MNAMLTKAPAKGLSFNIPFQGFYESLYSSEVDHEQERWIEYELTEREDGELSHPEEIRLNESEYAELFWDHAQYSIAYSHIARAYIDAFSYWAGEKLGFPLPLAFEEMTSPREYNFETDRLFAKVPGETIARLWAMSKADNHKRLSAMIRERFTSYDGFRSFYPNDLESWLEKPLGDWDHNELGTLLRACLRISGVVSRDWEMEVFYITMDGETGYHAFESCVDWQAFEKARDELRADKLAAFKEEHGEEAPEQWHYFSRDRNQLAFPFYTARG